MTNDVQINVHWNDDDVPRGMARTRSSVSAFSDDVGRDMDTKLKAEGEKAGQDLGKSVKKKAAESSKQTGSLMGAAIGLGLSASAPIIAGAMIGGVALGAIGMVVAAQKGNAKVASSFAGLKNQVVTEMKSATDQAVPYLVASGHQLQQTFANLGPQMAQAFSYAGPDIQILTAGVDRFATNAMPGMVNAMRGSAPIVQGIATLMAGLGTTATTVLTAVSAHSQQFGHDIGQLSGLVQNLGGVVGGVLPGLASGFGGTVGAVNTLLTAVKPIAPALGAIAGEALPVVGMFRLFGSAGDLLGGAGAKFTAWGAKVAASEGKASGLSKTLGNVGKGLGGVGGALPIVGAAFGVFSDVVAANDQKLQGWAQNLIAGGQAAKQAYTDINNSIPRATVSAPTGITSPYGGQTAQLNAAPQQQSETFADLKARLADITKGLPAQQAALVNYSYAQQDTALTAGGLAQAQKELTRASNDAAAAQDRQNRELLSANQLLITNTKAVIDNEEAQLNLSDAQHAVTDAQSNYDAAVKKSGRGSQAAQEAANQLGHALDTEVTAAGAAAAAADTKGGADQKAADSARAQREEVAKLIDKYAVSGQAIPAALRNIANGLGVAANASGVTAAQFDNVRTKLAGIPPGKKITVNALTSEAVTELQSLGYKVANLRNGKFTVSANIRPAINSIQSVINQYNNRRVNIVVTTSGDVRALGTGKISARAAGGPVAHGASGMNSSGDWSVMNEYGGEAVRLPSGSTVVPAGSTAEAVRQATGATTSGGAVEMRFSGDVDTVVASMLTKLIRAGRVQLIDGNGKRVKVGS